MPVQVILNHLQYIKVNHVENSPLAQPCNATMLTNARDQRLPEIPKSSYVNHLAPSL